MNNEKQLPPELVEKIRKVQIETMGVSNSQSAHIYAQIAVDYSKRENLLINQSTDAIIAHLEQQRDELVEALKSCKQFIESNLDVLAPFPTRSELDKINELLKNYEDGKE